MPRITFEYSALYYLNWWLTRDRECCKAFESDDDAGKRSALELAATHYSVSRNFPLEYDKEKGFARLEPVLDVINKARVQDFKEPHVAASVLKVRDAIRAYYSGEDVLSATTKFLWIRFKAPIIISDGNVRKALKSVNRELEEFYTTWRDEYAKVESKIRAACMKLPEVREFCIDPSPATPQYLLDLASNVWFLERVFDSYLWHLGA